MMKNLKKIIAAIVLAAGCYPAMSQDADPGTFTIPDIKFDEQQVAEVEVYFKSEIVGYNGLQMEFWMPEAYHMESDDYGWIYDVNTRFARGYTFAITDHDAAHYPEMEGTGMHFYRFVGWGGNPIKSPCDGLFFSFPIVGPTQDPATENVKIQVKNIEFSPKQGNNPAYKNIFPEMEFTIAPNIATGVDLNTVTVTPAGTGVYYDLLGRPVGTDASVLTAGVYIVDGRKVYIR